MSTEPVDNAVEKNRFLTRREAILREAFWAYGEHHDTCDALDSGPCDCGYQDILNQYMALVNEDTLCRCGKLRTEHQPYNSTEGQILVCSTWSPND